MEVLLLIASFIIAAYLFTGYAAVSHICGKRTAAGRTREAIRVGETGGREGCGRTTMLKSCSECGHKISTKAMSCPSCGNVIREPAQVAVARWSPGVAAVLSFFLPGFGQLYKGQLFGGLAWFVLTALGYVLFVIPGLILHLFCIIGAASGDPYKGMKSFRLS